MGQILGGIGSGTVTVAGMALIIEKSGDDITRARNVGITEMVIGIAILAGPLLGSFLFHAGGYSLLYGTMTVVYICCATLGLLVFTINNRQKETKLKKEAEKNALEEDK